jgi:hypothetical protein
MSGKKDVPPGRPVDDQIVEMVRDWTFAMFGVSDGPKARRLLGMLRYAASERQAALEESGCGMAEATLALAARAMEHVQDLPRFRVGQAWTKDGSNARIEVVLVDGDKVLIHRSGGGLKAVDVCGTPEQLAHELSSGWTPVPDTGGT